MKIERFNVNDYDFIKNIGREIILVDEITNDAEGITKGSFICDSVEEAKELRDYMNRINQSKKTVFIACIYTVEENGLNYENDIN